MNNLNTFFEISSQQHIRELETQTQIQIIKKDIKAATRPVQIERNMIFQV